MIDLQIMEGVFATGHPSVKCLSTPQKVNLVEEIYLPGVPQTVWKWNVM